MERPERYIDQNDLVENFEDYLEWIDTTGGRIFITDPDTYEVRAVMISAAEARELGMDLGEDETGTD